jgi:hypothetical protein
MFRTAGISTAVAAFAALVAALAVGGVVLAGGQKNPAYTDPAQAGPDFAVQGEYLGQIQTDAGILAIGVQVIALGDGKFRAVGYPGGLPGAGWDGKEKHIAEGQTKDGKTVFTVADSDAKAVIKDGVLEIVDGSGKTIGTLKKTERKSPTLGAKPPAGAVVLFDGTSADNFKGGRMTPDGLLMEGATSKQTFGAFTLHMEFRTPFQPFDRGQGRGNSGVYAQGRYEVQILDSFGLEGENNECGGIYGVARPKVNMCLPPLSWQTYDIDFTPAEYKDGKKVRNARMTVRHNGVVIHQDVEIPKATTAAPLPEGPEPGPIFLQNHGNPVRFRNIWVVEKK